MLFDLETLNPKYILSIGEPGSSYTFEVAEKVGFTSVNKLDFPTMSLTDESLIKMIPMISEVFNRIKPEVVYILNRSDAHSDHNSTFRATLACTKSFRYPFVKKILMYECISETEFGPALAENTFIPNYFVDVTKLQAVLVIERSASQ